MLHKGIRQFSPQELSSLALSQLGFDILHYRVGGLGNHLPHEAVDYGIKYWIEIKAVDALATVKAKMMCAGMDLTSRDDDNSDPKGVATDDFVTRKYYGAPGYGGSTNFEWKNAVTGLTESPITILQGKSIVGIFDKIIPFAVGNLVMAVRGPKID